MKKIIDGKDARMGRLASYVAKQALKGDEIVILNCEHVIITGNKKDIQERFVTLRTKGGSSQKGPVISKSSERIVKRAIRGMLPEHRWGRGRDAMKRIMCYNGIPKEFEKEKKIVGGKDKGDKYIRVREIMNEHGK